MLARIPQLVCIAASLGGVVESETVAAAQPQEMDLLPVATIGAPPAPLEESFVHVGDLVFISDSMIAISDLSEATVRLFGVDGRLRRTLGQRGRGPAEFNLPIVLHADSMLRVFDPPLNREVMFTLDGDHVATRRIRGTRRFNVTARYGLPNGQEVGRTSPQRQWGSSNDQTDVVVFVYDSATGRLDTLDTFHGGATIWRNEDTGAWGALPTRFGPGGALGVRGDIVAVANGYDGIVRIFRAGPSRLALERTVSLGLSGSPIEAADIEEMRERWEPVLGGRPGRRRYIPPPGWSVAQALEISSDGRIWVKTGVDSRERETWLIMNDTGPARHVRLPPQFQLKAVRGDLVAGRTILDDDVQVVRIYRIR